MVAYICQSDSLNSALPPLYCSIVCLLEDPAALLPKPGEQGGSAVQWLETGSVSRSPSPPCLPAGPWPGIRASSWIMDRKRSEHPQDCLQDEWKKVNATWSARKEERARGMKSDGLGMRNLSKSLHYMRACDQTSLHAAAPVKRRNRGERWEEMS